MMWIIIRFYKDSPEGMKPAAYIGPFDTCGKADEWRRAHIPDEEDCAVRRLLRGDVAA